MAASAEVPSEDLKVAVERAANNLVRVEHRRFESFVRVPVFYPSGSGATLGVTLERNGFRVSDLSAAYQEASMVGAETGFGRRAKKVAEKYGLMVTAHSMTALAASAAQLTGVLSNVAAASAETADYLVNRATRGGEKEVSLRLLDRLYSIFGQDRVLPKPELRGASGRDWELTALVKVDDGNTAFKAVGNHAQSVYYASAALHDITRLTNPPKMVSVVHDVHAMGSLYHILAQAGDIMEEVAADESFVRAVSPANRLRFSDALRSA